MRFPFALGIAVLLGAGALESRAAAEQTAPPATNGIGKPRVQQEFGTARALSRDSFGAADAYSRMYAALEILFPDLRLQTPARLLDGVDALVVSWPIHVASTVRGRYQSLVGASLFVEPQLPTNAMVLRGLAGFRAFGASGGFGAVLEGGGLIATDGSGLFAGAGPAVGNGLAIVSLMARRYFVAGEDRHDFTIELTLPLWPLVDVLRL